MAFVRLVVVGVVLMSVVYVAVSLYSRSIRREKLENEWAEAHPGATDSPAREDFIEAGMAEYQSGLRRKLIALVYVVPTIAVTAILIITNWN